MKAQDNESILSDKKTANIFHINPALRLFDNRLQAEIFFHRCSDIGEPFNLDKAKMFKIEFLKLNPGDKIYHLNLQNLRIGSNTILTLSDLLKNNNVTL